jgi:hypothetical protein
VILGRFRRILGIEYRVKQYRCDSRVLSVFHITMNLHVRIYKLTMRTLFLGWNVGQERMACS